jgi:3-phenylpropionate/trans-cinnamate dioxygenase ferredoxin subunit
VADAPRYVKVAAMADLPPGASLAVGVDDVSIALFNVAGSIYAIDNVCPHAGAPLARGALGGPGGAIVTCPLHGWRFDVRTGCSPHLRGEHLRTFPVRVTDGQIAVDIAAAAGGEAST